MNDDEDEHMTIVPLAATKVATIYAQGYVFGRLRRRRQNECMEL